MHTKKSKIFTGIFTLLLILGTLLPMFGALRTAKAATNDPVTVKITNAYKGAEYKGWKILNATETSEYVEGTSGPKKLKYTVPDGLRATLGTALGLTQGADSNTVFDNKIIQKLSSMTDNSDDLVNFARKMYDALKSGNADLAATSATDGTAGKADSTVAWENVGTGYYILSEDTSKIAAADQVAGYKPSLTVLKAVADSYATDGVLTIEMKHASEPTVEKLIKEDSNLSTETINPLYRKVADHNIGDIISFRLKATVPANVASFKKYYMTFNDTLSKGLTYKGNAKVYLVRKADAATNLTTDVDTVSGKTWAKELATSEITINATTTSNSSNTLTVKLADLTDVSLNGVSETSKLAEGDVIIVEYTAELNENAVVGGTGNPNTVYLTYASDPKADDGGDPGRTPEDKVVDFTFAVDANKVDGAGTALQGAGFTLYKYTNKSDDKDIANITGWKKVSDITPTESSKPTTFSFSGLDQGTYKLVETTVPKGYNKADDVDFTIVPTYDNATPPSITKLEIKKDNTVIGSTNASDTTNTKVFTVDLTAGKATTQIVNNSGKELPSTGGMGTVILYTAGAILAVGAGVYLIIKRRTTVK